MNEFIEKHKDYDIDDWMNHFIDKRGIYTSDAKNKEIENIITLLKRIKKNGDLINPNIYLYIKLLNDALFYTFETWEYNMIKMEDSIIIYNDVIYIEIYEENNNIHCSIGFGYNTEPYVSSYASLIINDVFNSRINIIENVFMINTLDNTFIWGRDEIKKFKNISKGYTKVKPYIIHNVTDDKGNVIKGNC